jgi:hypothetical protein
MDDWVEVKRRRFPMVAQISVSEGVSVIVCILLSILQYIQHNEARYQTKETTEDTIS